MKRYFWCKRCDHTQLYTVNPETLKLGGMPFFHRCASCGHVHVYQRDLCGVYRRTPEELRSRGVEMLLKGDGKGSALCCDLFVNWYALATAAPRSIPRPRREIPPPHDPVRRAAETADSHVRLMQGRHVVLTDKARAMVARIEVGQQRPLRRYMSYEDMISAFLVMDGSDDLEINWAVQCRFDEAQGQRGSYQPTLREQFRYTHG